MNSFHKKWTQIFTAQRQNCVFRPPAIPQGELTPAVVTEYKRTLDSFHRIWGSRWIWLLCFPLLFLRVLLQHCYFFLRGIVSHTEVTNRYRSAISDHPITTRLLSLLHMILRGLFIPFDIAHDTRQIFAQNAIWRKRERLSPFAKAQTKDQRMYMFLCRPLVGFLVRKGIFFPFLILWILLSIYTAQAHDIFQENCKPQNFCSIFSKDIVVLYGDYKYEAFETTTFFLLEREYDDGSGDWELNGWFIAFTFLVIVIILADSYLIEDRHS